MDLGAGSTPHVLMHQWDTEQYLKFKDERTQPVYDLVAKISHRNPQNIIDAGCGPGNSTEVLSQYWPSATISGFDSSSAMLEKASKDQNIKWFKANLEDWEPNKSYDIILSNAVLHWIKNHEVVIPKLISFLNHDGVLAFQVPAHYKSSLHQGLIEVAEKPEWSKYTKLAKSGFCFNNPSFYYNLLTPITSKLDIWETQYFHVLDNTEAILEWFRGTGLRPFLEVLPNNQLRKDFENELLEIYKSFYPKESNGKILLPFNRLFVVSYK